VNPEPALQANLSFPSRGRLRSAKVSVIITCYNYERFLERACNSFREQDSSGHELVVVDDGSTDDSLALAQEFARRNPQLAMTLISLRNGGLSRACNYGFRVSLGKHLLFLDADDYMAPSALREMSSFLDENPGLSVVSPNLQLTEDASHTDDSGVSARASPGQQHTPVLFYDASESVRPCRRL
jgi:glycosyltransferase involved in cell wall biosynthesis